MVCLVSRGPTTCEICGLEWKSTQSLSKHLTFGHGVRVKDYYDTHLRKDGEGVCQFCGGETKFYNLTYGYKHHCDASCKMKRQFRDMGFGEKSKATQYTPEHHGGTQKGDVQSPEHVAKMAESRRRGFQDGTIVHPSRMDLTGFGSAVSRGQIESWKNPTTRKNRVDAVTRANRDPRRRERMSWVMSRMILDGRLKYRGEWTTFRGEAVFAGSSYETRFLKANENNNVVLSIKKHPFRIPYVHNGATVNYLPDFLVTYVSGKRDLVEIKPQNLVDTEKNQEKFRAGRIFCGERGIQFLVMTESDIDLALVEPIGVSH